MKRLTSNKNVKDMGMVELAHNSCYIKEGKARYRDYDIDVDARVLTRQLIKDFAAGDDAFTCDDDFEEWMVYYLQEGMDSIDGLIALFYRNLWAMAEIREKLKYYEDAEEQGLLFHLPCKLGDVPYWISDGDKDGEKKLQIMEDEPITAIVIKADGIYISTGKDTSYYKIGGRNALLTKEDAEKKLKEMEAL